MASSIERGIKQRDWMFDESAIGCGSWMGLESYDGTEPQFGPTGFGCLQRTKGRTKDRVGKGQSKTSRLVMLCFQCGNISSLCPSLL